MPAAMYTRNAMPATRAFVLRVTAVERNDPRVVNVLGQQHDVVSRLHDLHVVVVAESCRLYCQTAALRGDDDAAR